MVTLVPLLQACDKADHYGGSTAWGGVGEKQPQAATVETGGKGRRLGVGSSHHCYHVVYACNPSF